MREAPSVEAARKTWEDKIAVLGVAWSGDERTYTDFIETGGLTFPQIDDTAGVIYEKFGIPYQPAAVILHRNGEVSILQGVFNTADVEAAIAQNS